MGEELVLLRSFSSRGGGEWSKVGRKGAGEGLATLESGGVRVAVVTGWRW